MKLLDPLGWRLVIGLFTCTLALAASERQLVSWQSTEYGWQGTLSDGEIRISVISASAVEVNFLAPGRTEVPRAGILAPTVQVPFAVRETPDAIELAAGQVTAIIHRRPFRIEWHGPQGRLWEEESGYFTNREGSGFRFRLSPGDKLLGGGERVLGMDRRGRRLELYNKPSYGYENHAELMYYSLPVVISSRKFALLFDNGARGYLDLGATEKDVLEFGAVGGRMSYTLVTGNDWRDFTRQLTAVTGRQPLPPRWALGNITSRMGYRSQSQTEAVARHFHEVDIPLDAIVLDLFWFGPELQGSMGNLEWDRKAFPQPEQMIATLREQGVKLILITEPFLLVKSSKYDEAARMGLLGTNAQGQPYTYDFYFGTTGLIDIFRPEARDWFWGIYRDLTASGVAGWWGDLGEPEVHPDDLLHINGRADEVHNLYGHEWTKMIDDGYRRDFPQERPVILMRSGFLGSQRVGMIPWTGDVNRSWGGLQPQVEISLQMGLQGIGTMHSDLGGFAGTFEDKRLYTRWLQYGVFQPIYRTHAQDSVPPEPIYWDDETKCLARESIRLRYALAPYHYTMFWELATSGTPLMRPLAFAEDREDLLLGSDGYLWGDAFLVYPVNYPQLERIECYLPAGSVWFDFWDGTRYEGGQTRQVATPIESIPVFVRAGSFIPMQEPALTLNENDGALWLHYWHDATVTEAAGQLYEDDGRTRDAEVQGLCEMTRFQASADTRSLTVRMIRDGGSYPGRKQDRVLQLLVHHWVHAPASILAEGKPLTKWTWDRATGILTIPVRWESNDLTIQILAE